MPEPQSADNAVSDDIASLSYEDARAQLGEVVQKLEAGGTTLEESMTLWQRGEKIADQCEKLLQGAQQKLDKALAARDDEA
ncbi:exodeoxyribonuclease VII small subunit [Antricoccus suffuscus]|uniref:Exodeoxyribonuclease 7 small subunit n=1 Tax=Antricoccus suffuscus TaxID=1629062 RepID=A0A2T0ZXA7_9ACTN|nr:exodeoxyribonuclease VII small subunit [Antricoccus suffuscus]PRZ40992.1 exodeoxyribonuclease VII small subunit [Antricoccus suffuscus]